MVKSHHKDSIGPGTHYLPDKGKCGVLLKLEPELDRIAIAGVNQHGEMQRQIAALLEKREAFRRRVIIEQGKIVWLQIANKVPFLVGNRESEVHFVDVLRNGRNRSQKSLPASFRKLCLGKNWMDRNQ